ncbi:two-component system, OmpR family, sensor histidine kinase QseC [Pseudovibrio ascidiaceicola]|uniref:histidine kinase n=1 Tax=Pseudovibrio ascidiaceicola TaxID=285279 RepID=A0A1I4E728_9HYPH|nr:ATP-binding protein [Pseudovibrio ascidiaceicola]SFL01634.1 two-component system, OmpR family, sensor histidine kinase QseC [Pseudovibrio ascidiaceicola]
MKLSSIRRRILIFLIPLLFVVWGVFSAIVYNLTEEELYETHDAQTFQLASVIAQLQGDTISPEHLDEHHVIGDYFVVIRDASGNDIYKSSDKVVLPKTLKPGVQEIEHGRDDWVVWNFPGQKTGQHYIIGVIFDEAIELADQTVATVSIPLALVLVFSIIATIFIVKRGLRPLTALSETLATREPGNLGKVTTEKQADELVPIVDSLNMLFDKIEEHLAREQRFIDDAAHEIRTPLTVVKAQCQVIERDALDDATRLRFDNIIEGVDRATHLAAKLLEHARAGQDVHKEITEHDLLPVLQESLAQQAHAALDKNVELQLLQSEHVEAVVDPEDLGAVLGNLIGNAIRHTPSDGEVIVVLERRDDHIQLSVEDSGPGVPEEYREKVFERFFRMPGQSSSGAGLGLSITQTLCRRNGIEISLGKSERLGGACFVLKLKK